MAFIDFSKAFDSIEWPILWDALITYGIHPVLINLLIKIYENSQTNVRIKEEEIEVEIERGVKQGDVMSPILFNAVLQMAIENIDWRNNGIRIDGKNLCHLEYADDLVLFTKSRNELKEMIEKLTMETETIGLKINTQKSLLMTNNVAEKGNIKIEEQDWKYVEKIKYLGCSIEIPLCDDKTIQ